MGDTADVALTREGRNRAQVVMSGDAADVALTRKERNRDQVVMSGDTADVALPRGQSFLHQMVVTGDDTRLGNPRDGRFRARTVLARHLHPTAMSSRKRLMPIVEGSWQLSKVQSQLKLMKRRRKVRRRTKRKRTVPLWRRRRKRRMQRRRRQQRKQKVPLTKRLKVMMTEGQAVETSLPPKRIVLTLSKTWVGPIRNRDTATVHRDGLHRS